MAAFLHTLWHAHRTERKYAAGPAGLFTIKKVISDQKKKRYNNQPDQIMACQKKHKQHSHRNPKRDKPDHPFHAFKPCLCFLIHFMREKSACCLSYSSSGNAILDASSSSIISSLGAVNLSTRSGIISRTLVMVS